LLPDAHLSLRAFECFVFFFYAGHGWELFVNWTSTFLYESGSWTVNKCTLLTLTLSSEGWLPVAQKQEYHVKIEEKWGSFVYLGEHCK
jgi:hypothetical protein